MNVPRALSLDVDHPHYVEDHREKYGELIVKVNGVLCEYAVAYDMDAGTVTRNVAGEDGKPLMADDRSGFFVQTVSGDVTVDVKPGTAPKPMRRPQK